MSRSSAAAPRLAAAEVTERVCYGMELDPKYVDVVVLRWQRLTGKKATLDGDGRTFEEIAAERKGIAGEAAEMGLRGPAKKPSAVEIAEGRPGKRSINDHEPAFAEGSPTSRRG